MGKSRWRDGDWLGSEEDKEEAIGALIYLITGPVNQIFLAHALLRARV
jgi:hypothetical protein